MIFFLVLFIILFHFLMLTLVVYSQTITWVIEGKNRKLRAGQQKKTEKADLVMEDC